MQVDGIGVVCGVWCCLMTYRVALCDVIVWCSLVWCCGVIYYYLLA